MEINIGRDSSRGGERRGEEGEGETGTVSSWRCSQNGLFSVTFCF